MTRQVANQLFNKACDLIFSVELELKEGEYPRIHGHRARIEIGKLQDGLKERKESDISTILT